MKFLIETVEKTSVANTAEHQQALRIANVDFPLTKRWVDTERDAVFYVINGLGGPGWTGCEFALFLEGALVRFEASWEARPGTYECRASVQATTPSMEGRQEFVQGLIREALHAYCSKHAEGWWEIEKFSVRFPS